GCQKVGILFVGELVHVAVSEVISRQKDQMAAIETKAKSADWSVGDIDQADPTQAEPQIKRIDISARGHAPAATGVLPIGIGLPDFGIGHFTGRQFRVPWHCHVLPWDAPKCETEASS